ncbi:uroporphyrinogen-III C-methyltransferase [Halomonas salina]|uniref:uroporphyrinogen-III C-methyltransferase n=1 Tax=Halomonas salina TaxID=42565 RepID=UPI00068FE41C|nr:uroporphyrinogen-III C-methyltransferase [Halomonas salina]
MRAPSKPRTPFASPDALRRGFSALARLGQGLSPRLRAGRVGEADDDAARVSLRGECRPGRVYLVGAGSGDVELLTLKAARLLAQADAVVYDRLVGEEVLALIPAGRERYYVGKASGHHSVPQDEIGALLVALAGQGKSVVRLKGGDPGVFGRMGEELAALAEAKVSAEIVPGITAASAACASMGIPLTDRAHAQQLRFVTAQLCREGGAPDWAALARRDETLVFYMGLAKVEAICAGLRGAGLPDDWPIMLVANASLPEQAALTGTLADMPARLAETPLPSPCLIVVGSVVRMVEATPAPWPPAWASPLAHRGSSSCHARGASSRV